MKKFLFLTILTMVGCASINHAQVGPGRFAITSRNNDYTRSLEMAYADCRSAGYKDYVILNTLNETKGSSIVVQCVDEPRKEESHTASTSNSEDKKNTSTNDASSTVQKIFQDIKDTFKK